MHGASSKLAAAEENQGMREVELARGSEGTVGHAPETARVSAWETLGAARGLFAGAVYGQLELCLRGCHVAAVSGDSAASGLC